MNRIEQCPQCSYFAEGNPEYNVTRQGVRAGVKFAGKKVLVYIVSIVMFNIIFPIVGTIPGFIIAMVLCYFAFSAAETITDSVDQELYSSTRFEFKCSHCGTTWKRTYEKGVDITTDEVLRFQKDSLEETISSEAKSSLIVAAIFGVITFLCLLYCIFKNSTSQTSSLFGTQTLVVNWTWWLLCFCGIITFLVTYFKGKNCIKKYEDLETLKGMSISDFRHSPYRNIHRSEWLNNQSAPRTKPLQTVVHQKENTKPMRRSPYCGEEIQAVAKKCKHCGECLNNEPEQPKKEYMACPVCGEQVEKGVAICPYCNEPINADDSASNQQTDIIQPEQIKQKEEEVKTEEPVEVVPMGPKTEDREYYEYDIDVSNLHTNERVQKYGYADAKVQTIITNKDMDKNLVNPPHSSVTLSGMYRSAPNAKYIDIEVKVLGNNKVPQYIGSYLFNDIELKRINNTTLFLYENMPYQFIEAKMFSCPICGEKIPEGCTVCPQCKEPLN